MLELLNQLDGFEASNQIKVIMATNRLDILDSALLRPGRIDRKIEFPNPTEDSRVDILKIHSRKMNLVRGIDLKKIASKMGGASGAEQGGVHGGGHVRAARAQSARHARGFRDGGGEGDAEGLGEERLGGETLHVRIEQKFFFKSWALGFFFKLFTSSFVASSLVSPVL